MLANNSQKLTLPDTEKFLNSRSKPVTLRSDYSFSYNPRIKNKVATDTKEYSKFTALSGSAFDLKDLISKGFAFSPSVYSKGERSNNNFLKADILAIDVDNAGKDENGNKIYQHQLTIEKALQHPFIAKYGVIYTSPSYQDNWQRFRIVFFLPYSIDSKELVKQLLLTIDDILGNVVDKACVDSARLFYGNDKARWFNFENAHELPHELIEYCKQALEEAQKVKELERQERQAKKAQYANDLTTDDKESLINELLSYIPEKVLGDGLYPDYRSIYCAVANEVGREKAIDIANAHSPCKDWTQVINSSNGEFSLGTIYHYARIWGGYSPSQNESESEYGKVILSGEDAIDRAKSSVTLEDLKKNSVITESELRNAIDHNEYSVFQEEFIRQHNKLSKKYRDGFSNRIIDIPNLNFTEITFNPDTFFLLQKSDIQDEVKIIIPVKYSNPILRAKIINHLRIIGVKYTFDRTQTGGGKSATVSKLSNILYLDHNYKNPSNPELKESPYLTPRTQYGLYMVNGEIKADPSQEIRELALSDNHPNIFKLNADNCLHKPLFLALQNNGYGGGDNLPCKGCDRQKTCHFTPGFYKHETSKDVANILQYGQGRLHPSQLSTERYNTTFPNMGLVWEEVGTLAVVKELLFTTSHIDSIIVRLAISNNEIIATEKKEQLIQSLNYLKTLISISHEKSLKSDPETGKFYGFNYQEIMRDLPPLPELNPDEYLSLIGSLNPLQEGINDELLAPNVMKLLDALLAPTNKTILSTHLNDFGLWVLGVSYFDDSYSLLSKQAKFNLFMDATATITQVKSIFEIEDFEPLVIIQNEIVELDNLNIFNINIQGLGSNDWSQESIDRTKEAVKLIRSQNPDKNIAVMTLKRYAEALDTNYWYGKHDRGTNELKDYDAIIFVGTPFINVGSVKREYEILFSDKENAPTFEQFYNQKIYELRMQGMGRSRAQYKSKPVHQFYLTTGEDLSYLKELGVSYQEISGTELSPLLGSKGDRTLFKIKNVVLSLIKSGIKVTCQAVADNLALTKQAISKAITGLGLSWKDFIICQLRLLESYIGKVDKNGNENHWSEHELKNNPISLIKMATDNIAKNGMDGFLDVVKGLEMPYSIASRLLWILSPLFDERIPLNLTINNSI
jgi:hypothetical protein